MKPPALAAGPAAPVRAAPGASADLLLPPPKGTQPFSYQWSRAGASLDDRFTTSEDASGVRLTVSSAQTGDSGVYTLQASNAAGSSTSKIRLEVAAEEAPTGEDPPTFLRRLQDLTVKVGSRTRFLVEIISSTECKVTWYRNERRLLEAERVALARDGNFWCADVAAVSVDDAGRWTCTAENAGGRASCSAHLNVLVPKAYKRPEFVEELRALLTQQGTVSLECKVVGVPTPVLRWFKDSREIKAGDVFALTANAEDPTSLGTYTCEAVNCMGRAYSSSKVHVVGRASIEGSARPSTSGMTPEPPPIFTKELEDAHVNVCESLTLGCHIVVPPWPRGVVWYNKEGKVEPGERYHVLEDGVGGYLLEIPSAEWADEGEWKCVATSAGGRVGITTCYVAMDVPKNYRKPRFMENLQAVLTEEGLVSFECKVVGFPTPVLSWFKDGQELKPGDVYQLTGTNSLGSYCCMARNCMGQASSSAELTVEDIQNQLNEEEKLQLFSKNQAPKFLQGLKSVEAKIDEPFRFTIKVAIPPEPSVLWYRDDQPVDESTRCHLEKEDKGLFNLDIQNLEFLDQAEWKCVAMNDFGHSVTSCFLKLIIPRHYKKPRFLENLQAILSDEGAVNLECKVIGVPQPVLKWYKDGEELKPGDIHRIISGQDGTCCLGTYTCEAQNCMGIAASSASLLGFDDSVKTKTKPTEEQPLQRNLSLSTIHEERTSQMYDTPVGDITQLDDKGEISFSFDGKEVSVSLYETPDLTEEEALQIVEMYADQLSENVTEQNVVELPPLRFVKETSTSGNLLMEAIIIDVSPDYFAAPEEDLRTEADVEDLSIADENGLPQLSLDQDLEIGGEDYLEKTMALLSEEKSDFAAKSSRRKSDSQRSADDFFSLSRDQSLSEEKRDDDTHVSESELQSFASARSSGKVKSKSSKPSGEEGQESSEPTKTILLKEEIVTNPSKNEETKQSEQELEVPIIKPKRERRSSRGSRRSSTSSEKSIGKSREELLRLKTDHEQSLTKPSMSDEEFKNTMNNMSTSLTKIINDVQFIERDIILKSELMSSAATASRSLEIISSLITPLSDIHSIADAAKESISESREVTSTIFNNIPQPLKALQQSLTIIEKCIDMESDNKTLVKKTCVAFIETCGTEVQNVINDITSVTAKNYIKTENKVVNEIDSVASEMITVIKLSAETINTRNLLSEAIEIKQEKPTLEIKHLRDTQKAVFELKSPLNSLLRIVKNAVSGNITDLSKIKQSEVIMNDMSASIQDLQTALEQIEFLSVKESSTNLHKYNTEIIETVMDPILKLRGSFELLSTEPNTKEDKTMLQETLMSLKENLTEISYKIETIDKNVGQFDILQSENKLDVLQKMAQILIALENNLPRLETMTTVKSHMDTFHKNLTKVLEKVIESNDANKYLKMMEICDTVNIINSSIKNLDAENVLPLASLSNTLKIIEINLAENIFEPELNCSIISNISNVLMGIQEAINKTEEISLQIDSEYIQDLSTQTIDEAKVNIILEHIDQTIAAVNTIKTIECTQDLKLALTPALENICPILEDLKQSVASVRPGGVEQDEHVSEMLDFSFAQTIATPLCELNQIIIVLNQLIGENIDYIKDSAEVITAIAEPLHELHITLEILQQDVISQYGDDLTPYEVSVNMASVVQNLQSCIVMIHEQAGIEGTEEMSTLEDISGIKTSADTLPSDCLVLPEAEETAIEQSLVPFTQEIATTATAQTLQTLNEHIIVLQTPEVIEALDSLSEISDYSSLKSVIVGLGDLHSGLEGILHPVPMEGSTDIDDTTNISKLASIAKPMQIIHQGLSVFDTSNIPVYENILDMPAEKVHSVFQSISELKNSLEECMCAVLPAIEIANNTIEISNKVSTLREVCKQLNEIFATSKNAQSDIILPKKVQHLEIVVNNLIDATDKSKDIKIDQVKCITEELYSKVMGIQEDIIHFTTQSPEKTSQEAKLIQIVSEVETNIAVLEQYDFIDLSRVSDITTCMSPQIAAEIDSESLAQIDDIAEDAANVLQDYYEEIPIADLMIVEDFFKTCKNEFTILRCLISKATSHKKIIRLLQEFNSLQSLINNFTTKRLELSLSDDVNECITNFLIHADECLRNARNSLVKVVDSQSDILIKTPLTRLESIRELKHLMENKTTTAIVSVVKTLQDIAETSKPLENILQTAIIEELFQPNQAHKLQKEEKLLTEKMEHLTKIIDAESQCKNLNDSYKVFEKLALCIDNHHGYKDASGTGKTLIILKCLAECAIIVQEEETENKISINETTVNHEKENSLKEVLAEMLQPLQALQTQLVSIREQVLSGAEEDSISIDITATESIMQTMADLHKDIVQQIEVDKSALLNEDIALIEVVDKEIHTIQDSIKSMENVQVAQAVKEITKPMEAIEKSLHTVISPEKDKETLPKETPANLMHDLDQYIELIEIVEEISAVVKIEDVNEPFDIARELRENIAACENEQNKELISIACVEQARLAQKLQTALSALQVQVLDSEQELAPSLSVNTLQRIAQVTAQLQADLVALTGIQISVQVPSTKTTKPTETTQKLSVSATTSESVEAMTKHLEQIDVLDKETRKEHVTVTTEHKENITATSQEAGLVEEVVKFEQESSNNVVVYAQDSKANEAETESCSIKIDSPKTALSPVMAKTHEENVVDSHSLETQELFKEEKQFTLSTAQENLMQHISEYVSEDIIQAVNEVSFVINAEELRHSINIANELQKCIAATIIITKEENNDDEFRDQHELQEKLAVGLKMALSVINEDTLEHLHDLVPSVNKETIEKIVKTIENLKAGLTAIETPQQEVLEHTKLDQQDALTKLETPKYVEENIVESSKHAEKTEKKIIGEDSTNLVPVVTTSVAAEATASISSVSVKSSDVLTETASVVKEIKQDEKVTTDQHETAETQEKFVEEQTVTVLQEGTKRFLQSKSDEHNVEVLEPVTKTIEVRQEEISVEVISKDALCTQEVLSLQTTQEMTTTAAEAIEVKYAMPTSEISEQVLPLEGAELDLSIAEEEKVAQVSITSNLIIKDEQLTDSHKPVKNDVISEVATETFVADQSTESTADDKLQVTQATQVSAETAAKETLTQTINAFLSDIVLHTVCEQPINTDEFIKAVQIAKDLQQYVITSKINTADELKNKLHGDFEHADLTQRLQQALSIVEVQLLENISETSPTLNYELQEVVNVILQLTDKISIALSFETVPKSPELDSKKDVLTETQHTEVIVENIDVKNETIVYQEDETEKQNKDKNKTDKRNDNEIMECQILKNQSSLEAENIFVECCEELVDNSKKTDGSICQKSNLGTNISETVFEETTKPFEEFFDSPTLADELPLTELMAMEVGETTILEHIKNDERCSDTTESAHIRLCDSFVSAVTTEIDVTEDTEIINDKGSNIEEVVLYPEVKRSASEVTTSNPINAKENTTQQDLTTQELVTVCYDVEPVIMQSGITSQDECFSLETLTSKNFVPFDQLSLAELNTKEVTELKILEGSEIIATEDKNITSATLGISDSLTSALACEINTIETAKLEIEKSSNHETEIVNPTIVKPLFATVICDGDVDKVTVIDQVNTVQKSASHDLYPLSAHEIVVVENLSTAVQEAPITSNQNNVIESDAENILTGKPLQEPSDLQTKADTLSLVKITTTETVEITTSNDKNDDKEVECEKTATVSRGDNNSYAVIDEVNLNEATEVRKEESSNNDTVTVSFEVEIPQLEVTISSEPSLDDTTLQESIAEIALEQDVVFIENKFATEDQPCFVQSPPVNIECSNLIQHLDAFICDEVTEIVNEISNVTNTETLKDSVAVAKKLRECILATDYRATAEETSPISDNFYSEQAHLTHILQNAFSTWHTQALDIADVTEPIITPHALQKISEIILHIQDSLAVANVSCEAEIEKIPDIGDVVETKEQNSIAQLESLLQDVNIKINLAPAHGTMDTDNSESLKDTLDEVQTVIIKLKREYDGTANYTLNETLEDLECSVRSVQLQINEESPPELLTEACATLQLLVDNMNATQQTQVTQVLLESEETILEKCSDETEETVKLLDIASKLDTKGNSNLTNIVSNLKTIKDNLKSLRESFLIDAETVIENGVIVIECLNQVEENIYSLEKDVDMAENITIDTRDSIISAVHSVYGSISNMRSTVSSVQKRFMFENYGKPSESLLHSIKNITIISSSDDEGNKPSWKRLSKSLRKVLNHFEDIKFYINLDKTARLPSDAAFTKIILEELKDNIFSVLVPRAKLLDSNVLQKVNDLLKCVETNLTRIESHSSLQVKSKIPMFKNIAVKLLTTTMLLKNHLENPMESEKTIEESESLDVKNMLKDESPGSNQEPQELTESIATVTETLEVKPMEENSSDLVRDEMSKTTIKYVTEAEILLPLEKQASIVEANTDCSISKTEKMQKSAETKYLLPNLDEEILLDAEQSQTKTVVQSKEIDELPRPQISQVVLETSGTQDLTLQATTSKQGYDMLNVGLTEVEAQNDGNQEVAKSSDEVKSEIKLSNENDLELENALVILEKAKSLTISDQVTQLHEKSLEREQNESSSKTKTIEEDTTFVGKTTDFSKLYSEKKDAESSAVGLESKTREEDLKVTVKDNETKKEQTENKKSHNEDVKKQVEYQDIKKAKAEQESEELKPTEEFPQISETENSQSKTAETLSHVKQPLQVELEQLEIVGTETPGKDAGEPLKRAGEKEILLNKEQDAKTKEENQDLLKKEKSDPVNTESINIKEDASISGQEVEHAEKVTLIEKQINQANKGEEKAELQQIIKDETCDQKEDKASKAKQDAAFKQKEQEEATAKTQKPKSNKEVDEVNQEADFKLKEKEAHALKEKGDADLKLKKEQEASTKEKAKKDKEKTEKENIEAEIKEKDEKALTLKEKAEVDCELKEEQEAQATQEKKDAEKENQEADYKQKEQETQVLNADLKLKREQEAQAKTEKDEIEIVKQEANSKQKEEEARALKEKADADLKLREEQEALAIKENEKAEKVKQEADLKQIVNQAHALTEKAEADLKLNEEQEEQAKEKEETEKVKQEADLKQKEEEARALKTNADADLKLKEELEALAIKEKEKAEKVKQETDLKQKEVEAHALEEKADADLKLKEKQEDLAMQEKEKTERVQQEADLKLKENQARALTEKAEVDLKLKEEQKTQDKKEKEEKEKVEQEDNLTLIEEEARALKTNVDADLKLKEELEALAIKEKDKANKVKQETDLKQKEEEARTLKEKADADLKFKEKQEALQEKEKAENVQQEADLKQKEEEVRALTEKAEADLKLNEEQKIQDKKEKEEKEKVKQEANLKQKEEEARALKEKADADLKIREEQEALAMQEKEKAEKVKQETDLKQKEEEARALKEKADADLKLREKQEALAMQEKEKAERVQQEADLKLKENQARALTEKAEADIKLKEEQKTQDKKEKEEKEKVKQEANLKHKEEEVFALKTTAEADRKLKKEQEAQANTEKEEADKVKQKANLKEKEEAETDANLNLREEQEAQAKKEKEKTEKVKHEDDLKQKEEACALEKKAEADRKLKKEQEAQAIKEKEEADKVIQEANLKHKEEEALALKAKAEADRKLREEHEAQAKRETEETEKVKQEAESKQKENQSCAIKVKAEADLKHIEEQETLAKKDKKETEKVKQEADLKLKEEEARALIEKTEADRKLEEEQEIQAKKEKEETEKVKQKDELKQKEEEARALKEKNDADLKLKEEQEALTKKETKRDKKEVKKAKQEAELKQKKEESRAFKEKAIADCKSQEEQEAQAKIQQEAELKQTEEKAHALKEKTEADHKFKEKQEITEKDKSKRDKEEAENVKQEADLKQKEEARALKEKADADLKRKKEEETLLQKDNDSVERKQMNEEKARVKKEKANKTDIAEKTKTESETMELVQEQKQEECALRKKRETELTLQDVQVENVDEVKVRRKSGKKKEESREKVHEEKEDEPKIDITETETKEIISHDVKDLTKKNCVDEVLRKTTKYTERLDKSERRDDEFHIYKEDPVRQTKKENGDINHYGKREISHEQRHIREYQYEPSPTGSKIETREKPRFVDHNHRDYTMEFARPSGYRERSFEVDKTDSLSLRDHLGRNTAIYRAQTLVLDSQLRSSSPLYLDPDSSRTSEPTERRSEIRHRSKAHSEARTIISDKRTGVSRDSKRKPVFSTYLTDRTAVEGSRVKLTCSVLSSSDPTVIWYKNGVLLDNKLKYKTKFMDGLITLEVLNAVPTDSAEYSCTIQNENGSVSSSANLKVYPSFEASPIPPTFTRSIRDTFHLAENELVLECRIRGQPLPTITWLKDDKSISTNSRYQAYYLADGVCRLAIEHPTPEDSGKYTCKAENSVWSDQITHIVNFTGKESRFGPNIATLEKSRFNRQALESRRPHFTNVLADYKVATGGTIGLQVEIRGATTRVEWLREGCSVTEVYRNAKTFVDQGLYTLALSDVTEKESGMYTCRAWSSQCHVDMNAAITVVQPNELNGKPAIIVGRPEKDILISIGEDVNISFRVQGEPKPKVVFMKGIRDITTNQRVCKMTSDDYVKFTLKRSVVSDAGTYCILARNAYGCDRAFVTVVVRQRASSDNLISDWTYPTDDSALSTADRKYKSVPERIPGEPSVLEGGNNWISLGWPKSEPGLSAPVLAYKVESWLLGKEGGARWIELGITPLNSFDAFNLKQGEEYHFRVTPRNRYGWGESVQTSTSIAVGLAGDRPEFSESLPGQLKVLVRETANLSCSVKGAPVPEVVWMKNGHEIEDEDRRISTSFNGLNCSLTIKDINIEDEARYSCEATNVHGRASTYARLAVVTDRSIWEADAKLKRERSAGVEGDYPPQFTMRLRDRRVQATYPVRLTCQVIGSPDPRITWFKDGGEVTPDNRRSHFQDEHFHTLEIAPTMLEDGGVYEAIARNSSGAVSCRCSLVVDKGIRAYVAPEFCCGLEPLYRLTDGEELRISAVVEAYPSVGVTWYRDGVRLRPSRRAIMTLDRDGQIELALAAVTTRDAGVYSCTASNEVGRASTSGKVEVTGTNVSRTPPVFISPDEPYSKEPMFIRKPRSSEAREGDTVIIACEVVGDPKPDVFWLRDFLKPDYYRDSSHFKRMGDGPEYRFEIPHAKLDYTGAYSVVARNQHGEAKAVISLQILAKDPGSSDETHNVRYGRVEVLPRFTKELTDLLSCDGDAVEFECRLSGHPEPYIRWFHYHEHIRDCPDFETSFDEGTARLKIKQVTAEDEGTYFCEAANNLGKATSSACLVVYPPGEPNTLSQRLRRPPAFRSAASTPRSTPRSTPARSVSRTPGPETRRLCSPARTLAPSFYTYPFNKVAEEGDPVTLQCAIKGNPAPWATWDKDGVIITPSSRITIKEKDDVLRVLEIDQVTIDDVGVYRITIENEFGRQEASARIEVITQKGKFYAGVRAVSPSPRKSLTYRSRRPSTPRQD